mgnify:CR=1 FL=1
MAATVPTIAHAYVLKNIIYLENLGQVKTNR